MTTRAELLADHFIQCAGIAAVYVDGAGSIGIADRVGIEFPPGRALLCCVPGNHQKVAAVASGRYSPGMPPADVLATVRAVAAELSIALTPHEIVIQRAFAAVEAVSQTVAEMQRSGGMKELNREFKEARQDNPQLRYHDYLHNRKTAMLAALASGKIISTAERKRPMSERTENEEAVVSFDAELKKLLKLAKRRTDQLWPGVVGQLEIAQHHIRSMMHPDDQAKAR